MTDELWQQTLQIRFTSLDEPPSLAADVPFVRKQQTPDSSKHHLAESFGALQDLLMVREDIFVNQEVAAVGSKPPRNRK